MTTPLFHWQLHHARRDAARLLFHVSRSLEGLAAQIVLDAAIYLLLPEAYAATGGRAPLEEWYRG